MAPRIASSGASIRRDSHPGTPSSSRIPNELRRAGPLSAPQSASIRRRPAIVSRRAPGAKLPRRVPRGQSRGRVSGMMATMGANGFHDSSYKKLFGHARMVEDLLRAFIPPDAVEAFEFATLEPLPAEYVADDLRQSRGDSAWRVRVRGGKSGSWLYLLVLLEFQSTVDRHMAARVLAYTGQMYLTLLRSGEAPPDGLLPAVLPMVLYNGRSPWSAVREVRELIAPVGAGLAPFQPRQRYHVVDGRRLSVRPLPPGNAVSAQIALEHGSPSSAATALVGLNDMLSGSEHASLRQAFEEWIRRTIIRGGSGSALASALRLALEKGGLSAMGLSLSDRFEEFAAKRSERAAAEGLKKGLEQGLEQGLEREREMLRRLAARRFGAAAAERLAAVLRDVGDADRLAEIGEHVIDCATGEALLARARGAAGRD